MLKTRKRDLILEAKNARLSSPERRLNASFDLMDLAEEIFYAANKTGNKNNES